MSTGTQRVDTCCENKYGTASLCRVADRECGGDPIYHNPHHRCIMTLGTIDNSGWDVKPVAHNRARHITIITPHTTARTNEFAGLDGINHGEGGELLVLHQRQQVPHLALPATKRIQSERNTTGDYRSGKASSTYMQNSYRCSTTEYDRNTKAGNRRYTNTSQPGHAQMKLCHNTVGQQHHYTPAPHTKPARSSQHSVA
jgi:hypothetical protein